MPRRTLDGAKLAADIARLQGEDKAAPPSAQPSLMDAVRGLATYIETRAKLGWTDPMIAAVLTAAGYPISAATLCSYRQRLRDEGLMAPLATGRQTKTKPRPIVVPSSIPPVTRAAEDVAVAPAATAAASMTQANGVLTVDAETAHGPPSPASISTFKVRTRMPPDGA